jgi:hypothetical protein
MGSLSSKRSESEPQEEDKDKDPKNDTTIELSPPIDYEENIIFAKETLNEKSSVTPFPINKTLPSNPLISINNTFLDKGDISMPSINNGLPFPSNDHPLSYFLRDSLPKTGVPPSGQTVEIVNTCDTHRSIKTSSKKSEKKSLTLLDLSPFLLCKIMLLVLNHGNQYVIHFTCACQKIKGVRDLWLKEGEMIKGSNQPNGDILLVSGINSSIERNCGLSKRYHPNHTLTLSILRDYINSSECFPKYQLFLEVIESTYPYKYVTFLFCSLRIIGYISKTGTEMPNLKKLYLLGDYKIDHFINKKRSDLIHKIAPGLEWLSISSLKLYYLSLEKLECLETIEVRYTPYNESDRHFIKSPTLDGSCSIISLPPSIKRFKLETNSNIIIESMFNSSKLEYL